MGARGILEEREFPMNWHFIGLDLGQSRDFTAIAVAERAELTGAWDAVAFAHRKVISLRLRYLSRVALGTPYPEIVEEVGEITGSAELAGHCHLVVDATGVGRPVVDLLRQARLGCRIMPVVITAGNGETQVNGYYGVPKRDLIIGLQVMLQQRKLQIAAGMEYGEALVREMAEMRVKVTASGHEQYGVWREGEHDDLVFAVALACWGAKKLYPEGLDGDENWWQRNDQRELGRLLYGVTAR